MPESKLDRWNKYQPLFPHVPKGKALYPHETKVTPVTPEATLPEGITDNTNVKSLVGSKLWNTFGVDIQRFADKRLVALGDAGIYDLIAHLNTERAAARTTSAVEEMDKVIIKLREYKAAKYPSKESLSAYGPPETAAPELKELWVEILKEVEKQYPLTHPSLLAEAKRVGVTPTVTQLMIAHERWLEERRKIMDRWGEEYEKE